MEKSSYYLHGVNTQHSLRVITATLLLDTVVNIKKVQGLLGQLTFG
jgi:hypothetical protein